MRKVLLGLALALTGLFAASSGEAEARPFHGRGGHGGYYRSHAERYSGGYYYRGRAHSHWARQVWSPTFHRYHYWDAGLGCYFYFDDARGGYYPCN